MTTRDQLATLIRDTVMNGEGRVDWDDIADAVMGRWELVERPSNRQAKRKLDAAWKKLQREHVAHDAAAWELAEFNEWLRDMGKLRRWGYGGALE